MASMCMTRFKTMKKTILIRTIGFKQRSGKHKQGDYTAWSFHGATLYQPTGSEVWSASFTKT